MTEFSEAELLTGPHDLGPHLSEEVIRVHPRRTQSWGLDEDAWASPPG
ncbi:hypothetical protein [Streptomyces olivochromogenes]|nr:hypothetical protein [Streptomyces olivochromogenes]MCF3136964.1 hypothetical protein [Streptomyces olivochromogenes]